MTDSEKNVLLLQWLKLHSEKISLAERIYERGYKRTAICGFREYGRLLIDELRKEKVEITCIIEKNYQSLQMIENSLEIPIVGFSSELNSNDAEVIIVTPDLDMLQVRENLEMAAVELPVIGLDSLLFV